MYTDFLHMEGLFVKNLYFFIIGGIYNIWQGRSSEIFVKISVLSLTFIYA
jgi:hypothetical protein